MNKKLEEKKAEMEEEMNKKFQEKEEEMNKKFKEKEKEMEVRFRHKTTGKSGGIQDLLIHGAVQLCVCLVGFGVGQFTDKVGSEVKVGDKTKTRRVLETTVKKAVGGAVGGSGAAGGSCEGTFE